MTAFIMLLPHVFSSKRTKNTQFIGSLRHFWSFDEDYYFHGVQVIPLFRHYTPQLLILIPKQHGRFVFCTPCFVAVLQEMYIIFIYLFIYLIYEVLLSLSPFSLLFIKYLGVTVNSLFNLSNYLWFCCLVYQIARI